MGWFVPVPAGKISALQQVLSKRLPNSTNLWNIAKTYSDNLYSSHIITTFYSYNDIIDDESLLFAVQRRQFPTATDESVTISGPANLQNVTDTIAKAFERAMNWNSEICFCAVDNDLVKHMKLPEMCSRNGKLVYVDPCYLYYYEIKSALKLDLDKYSGSGVIVRPLAKSEASIVTNSWKFAGVGTLERLSDSIETIGSAGVYVKEADGDKLASWVTMAHGGTINALYTHEDYRRRGYGRIVMEAVSRYAAEKGLIPSVQIELENQASKTLMEKVGYIYSHLIDWVIYHPIP